MLQDSIQNPLVISGWWCDQGTVKLSVTLLGGRHNLFLELFVMKGRNAVQGSSASVP